jgi:GPI-anchor transamidase subunit GAA1
MFGTFKYSSLRVLSVWVFLLLGLEAIKMYRTNPYFMLGTTKIPTWTTPLLLVLFVTFFVPDTSLLGHLCGLSIGYLCGLQPFLVYYHAD